MNFDEMKSRWTDYDRKLDAAIGTNAVTLDELRLAKAQSSLQSLSRWIAIAVVVDLIVVFFVGRFIAVHIGEPAFLVQAIVLDLYVILQLAASVRQLVELKKTDLGATIIDTQKRIETLRIERIRTVKWTLTLAPLLWVPLLVVGLKGVFGIDAYMVFPASWLVANILFGVAIIPLIVWVSKRYGDRFACSTFGRRLMDDLAGRSLASATAYLAELTRFEHAPDRDVT